MSVWVDFGNHLFHPKAGDLRQIAPDGRVVSTPTNKAVSTPTNPAHYKSGKIEVWDFIDDQQLGFFLGNAIEYICRAGEKHHDTYNEDLQKAITYIQKQMEINK